MRDFGESTRAPEEKGFDTSHYPGTPWRIMEVCSEDIEETAESFGVIDD